MAGSRRVWMVSVLDPTLELKKGSVAELINENTLEPLGYAFYNKGINDLLIEMLFISSNWHNAGFVSWLYVCV